MKGLQSLFYVFLMVLFLLFVEKMLNDDECWNMEYYSTLRVHTEGMLGDDRQYSVKIYFCSNMQTARTEYRAYKENGKRFFAFGFDPSPPTVEDIKEWGDND